MSLPLAVAVPVAATAAGARFLVGLAFGFIAGRALDIAFGKVDIVPISVTIIEDGR